MFWKKGFWLVFVALSAFHLVEDLFWAIIARFTSIPIVVIIGGILIWAMISTVFIHSSHMKKYWHEGHK